MKAETDKQLAEARLAALNLQSVLRAGNMDLLQEAYDKYIKALVTIPQVKAQFCNEDGSFIDINKQTFNIIVNFEQFVNPILQQKSTYN